MGMSLRLRERKGVVISNIGGTVSMSVGQIGVDAGNGIVSVVRRVGVIWRSWKAIQKKSFV